MSQTVIRKILRVDSSANPGDSVSRAIGDEAEHRLTAGHPGATVHRLDLAAGMPHIDADWVGANFTPPEQRSPEQQERLALSDQAVAVLEEADAVVITVPVYNFSLPSTLKAWIDHICRAGVTFRYTENGPQGLLADRPVYLVMASGGVPFGSPMDFASGYLKQVLRFIGIEDVRLVGAERVASGARAAQQAALNTLDDWLPVPVTRVD